MDRADALAGLQALRFLEVLSHPEDRAALLHPAPTCPGRRLLI